jgi:hypothetical protein
MRLFGVELTNTSPEKRSQPSSPEQRANDDSTRQPGESSTSRAGQRSVGDFTRHFATNPYYHQGESQPPQEAQQMVKSSANQIIRPVARRWSQEAQHHPEPSGDASSSRQPQGDLHAHARIENIQRALLLSINELERLRPPVPHTEHMVQQSEKRLLSSHHHPTSYSIDFASGSINSAPQEQGRKRKRDETISSSSRTPFVDGLAPQQQAQSDQRVNDQQDDRGAKRPKIDNYQRNYYEKNKEVILARNAEYYEQNKEAILAKKAEYYEQHKEALRAKNAAYQKKKRESLQAKQAE